MGMLQVAYLEAATWPSWSSAILDLTFPLSIFSSHLYCCNTSLLHPHTDPPEGLKIWLQRPNINWKSHETTIGLGLKQSCWNACHALRPCVAAAAAFLLAISAAVPILKMATDKASPSSEDQPQSFRYFQIYASADGTTHFKECKMTGFESKAYSSKPQFVRSEFGGEPTKLTFTELAVGLEQPLHSCPQVQFVVTLSGSWYVKTSDGTKHTFSPGEVLFQDNTKDSPAVKQPLHYSGVVGDKPCQQMIVQMSRTPEVDNPNPF